MRVILQSDVRGVGKRSEIKEVSDGFARNYLFPRSLAVPADEKGTGELLRTKKENIETIERLRRAANFLERHEFMFSLAVDGTGNPFGGVSAQMILQKIRGLNLFPDTARVEVHLEKPIKKLGIHRVRVTLSHGVGFSAAINIQPLP